MKRSVERQQSSSCDLIITDCSARVSQLEHQHDLTTGEGLAEYLSDVAVLACGSCFDAYEDYFICIGEDELAEQFREAECVLSDGKYCSKRLLLMEINAAVMKKMMLILLHAKISAIYVMFWDAVQFYL